MKRFDSEGSGPLSQQVDVKLDVTQDSLYAQMNFMLGRLKTVADASFSDETQRKAFKDLFSQVVWDRYNYMLEIWNGKGRLLNDGKVDVL